MKAWIFVTVLAPYHKAHLNLSSPPIWNELQAYIYLNSTLTPKQTETDIHISEQQQSMLNINDDDDSSANNNDKKNNSSRTTNDDDDDNDNNDNDDDDDINNHSKWRKKGHTYKTSLQLCPLHNEPLLKFWLLHATFQKIKCSSPKFLITLWPWMKIKVIHSGIKM